MFPNQRWFHTPAGWLSENVEEWILLDFPVPVTCLVHMLPDTIIGILKNVVLFFCTCDIDLTILHCCLGRSYESDTGSRVHEFLVERFQ